MHGANLDYMADFLTLEDAIPAASSHSSNIEKLRTIDHMVI